MKERRKLNICLVSDFFYPNVGGVESHIYNLAQQLLLNGHKVIVITHAYGKRVGIRYLVNGLKVYYVPNYVIVLREKSEIVHAHQVQFIKNTFQLEKAFSMLGLEALFHAKTLGLKNCFTDHSLFGFADISSVAVNKFLQFCLADIDHAICVSHTCKENTVLRASLNPTMVSVIPNAIVPDHFKPKTKNGDPSFVSIVVLSRLVYRKGIDLLIAIIPRICQKYPTVKFIIGGDGPKRVDLEQMRERYVLSDRVELLGVVKKEDVRSVLIKGDIFLNTSLTEAFCIAVVEAASCGLLVVSTKVGGIPEVLPPDLIHFGLPEEEDLFNTTCEAIEHFQKVQPDPIFIHNQVKTMYSWKDVMLRTEKVYYSIIENDTPTLFQRLERYYKCGVIAGKLFCIFAAIDFFIMLILEFFTPKDSIEPAANFDFSKYRKDSLKEPKN